MYQNADKRGICGAAPLAQFQRLFSDINLHVMSLRFGDFRVGTTDFVFVTWIHSRCEEATTRFEAQEAFSHPHLRSENDEVSSSARRYNIHSTAVGITKAIGKDYAESGHCCSMYCTYERGRIRLN